MKNKIQLIRTGISLVDNTWGGFYRGGTYLLVGARKSGRTLLSLQYAKESIANKEVCLFFTSMRPKDLMIQAASIDFDLQDHMNQNQVIVVRVAPPADLRDIKNHDDYLVEYLRDIVTVVQQYQPGRVVFDEITPFIGFQDSDLLKETFSSTTEQIENSGITSLFVIGDPATSAARSLVDGMIGHSTGVIYLKKNEDEGSFTGGEIVITPNIGHTEGQFRAKYNIEPYKGIVIEQGHHFTTTVREKLSSTQEDTETSPALTAETTVEKYTSLADMKIPDESLDFSNLYTEDDFKLILNNQIALFKSTGKLFTLIAFKLDPEAENNKLITMNQLKNSVRLSTNKRDKICVSGNKVIVMLKKEDQKSIEDFLSTVKNNLPNGNEDAHKKIIPFISLFIMKVDDSVQDSEDFLNRLDEDEIKEENNFDF